MVSALVHIRSCLLLAIKNHSRNKISRNAITGLFDPQSLSSVKPAYRSRLISSCGELQHHMENMPAVPCESSVSHTERILGATPKNVVKPSDETFLALSAGELFKQKK